MSLSVMLENNEIFITDTFESSIWKKNLPFTDNDSGLFYKVQVF